MRHMSLEILDAVLERLDDATGLLSRDSLRIRLGENGDLFLNPDAMAILRKVRNRIPTATIELYNHFFHLKPTVADILLQEGLVNAVYMNVDGMHSNYKKIKNIPLDIALANLVHFIERRNSLGLRIPISIRALTLEDYVATVQANYKRPPLWVEPGDLEVDDDYNELRSLINGILTPGLDSFKKSFIALWAERDSLRQLGLDESRFACPLLFRIEREIFVRPDGGCYLCCADSKQELVIGNLARQSFKEVVRGEKRRIYIDRLRKREFRNIGGPCTTVYCCQVHHKVKSISLAFNYLTKYSWLLRMTYEFWRKKWGISRAENKLP